MSKQCEAKCVKHDLFEIKSEQQKHTTSKLAEQLSGMNFRKGKWWMPLRRTPGINTPSQFARCVVRMARLQYAQLVSQGMKFSLLQVAAREMVSTPSVLVQ